MRPVPSQRSKNKKSTVDKNTCVDPAFLDELNNETFDALARTGKDVHLFLKATLSLGTPLDSASKKKVKSIFTSLTVLRKGGDVDTITPDGTVIDDFKEPLVIGYGASRHMGYKNSNQIALTAPAASLFDSSLELFDAEEILQQLEYSKLKREHRAGNVLTRLKEALATILPRIGGP